MWSIAQRSDTNGATASPLLMNRSPILHSDTCADVHRHHFLHHWRGQFHFRPNAEIDPAADDAERSARYRFPDAADPPHLRDRLRYSHRAGVVAAGGEDRI